MIRSPISQVRQPTLVMASRHDGSVGVAHADELARLIPEAQMVLNDAPSHLMWFGPARTAIDDAVRTFLTGTSGVTR